VYLITATSALRREIVSYPSEAKMSQDKPTVEWYKKQAETIKAESAKLKPDVDKLEEEVAKLREAKGIKSATTSIVFSPAGAAADKSTDHSKGAAGSNYFGGGGAAGGSMIAGGAPGSQPAGTTTGGAVFTGVKVSMYDAQGHHKQAQKSPEELKKEAEEAAKREAEAKALEAAKKEYDDAQKGLAFLKGKQLSINAQKNGLLGKSQGLPVSTFHVVPAQGQENKGHHAEQGVTGSNYNAAAKPGGVAPAGQGAPAGADSKPAAGSGAVSTGVKTSMYDVRGHQEKKGS